MEKEKFEKELAIDKLVNSGNLKWYTIQVYNGSELAVKSKIEILKHDHNIEEIKEILVPYEEVTSISPKGKKTLLKKAIYPAYVFIGVTELDKYLQKHINSVTKVSKIIFPELQKKDISRIISKIKNIDNTVKKYRVNYYKGDRVRILEGSFSNFVGIVDKFLPEKNEVIVNILILGRETPTPFSIDKVTLEIGN